MDLDLTGGFQPDADPTLPGIIQDCTMVIPTLKGLRSAPQPVAVQGLPALAAQARGAAVVYKLDASTRMLAGTATALYEASTTAWNAVTRSSGGAYTLGSNDRWRFAQFGDVTIAAAKSDTLQFSSAGLFADISGAPKAALVETVGYFVFVADTNEATFGDCPNRWWCSAIGNYSSWAPSIATQATSGVLTSVAGKITALRRFGDNIIVYKQRGMYLGTYQGPPLAWAFTEIPGVAGALSHECVVNVGTPENPRHIFMGFEDFYSFDGSRPVPIGTGRVREFVFKRINRSRLFACVAAHDPINTLVYFYYAVGDSSTPDNCVVYNYRTDRWGKANFGVEVALEYVAAGISYDDVGTYYPTYESFARTAYDSVFYQGTNPVPAVFDTTHMLTTLTGAATNSSIRLSEYGDEETFTTLTRVVPRWLTPPTASTLVNSYRHERDDDYTEDVQTGMVNARFDVLRSSRWHMLRVDFTGDWEMAKMRAVGAGDGSE
jgi:hypothetical protein